MQSIKSSNKNLNNIIAPGGLEEVYKACDRIIDNYDHNPANGKNQDKLPALTIHTARTSIPLESDPNESGCSSSTTLASREAIRFSGCLSPVIASSRSARFSLSISNDASNLKTKPEVSRRNTMYNKNPKNMHITISMNAARELKYKQMLQGNNMLPPGIDGLEDSNGNSVSNNSEKLCNKQISLYFSDCVDHEISKTTRLIIEQSMDKRNNTIYIYIPTHQTYKNMREMLNQTNLYSIPSYQTGVIDDISKRYDISIYPALITIAKNRRSFATYNGIDEVFSHISSAKVASKQNQRASTWLKFMSWK